MSVPSARELLSHSLQEKLPAMFEGLHLAHSEEPSRLKAESFKRRVMTVCKAWNDWAVYPPEFMISLQNIFLGLVKRCEAEEASKEMDGTPFEDVDGVPIEDPNFDGMPLSPTPQKTPLLASSAAISALMNYSDDEEEDIDGAPLAEFPPVAELPPPTIQSGTGPQFVSNKWESVSPERVEAQAMTLSKWDTLEQGNNNGVSRDSTPVYDRNSPPPPPPAEPEPDIDGVPMYEDYKRGKRSSSREDETPQREEGRAAVIEDDSRKSDIGSEARRAKLREVEVRVVQYQDELEKGVRQLKGGYTVEKQVMHYRHKLIKKIEKEEVRASLTPPRPSKRHSKRSRSLSKSPRSERRKRSRTPHKSRHRSRTPKRSRRSRSRTPTRKHKKKRH